MFIKIKLMISIASIKLIGMMQNVIDVTNFADNSYLGNFNFSCIDILDDVMGMVAVDRTTDRLRRAEDLLADACE